MLRLLAVGLGGVLLSVILYSGASPVDAANNADAPDTETIMKRLNKKKDNAGIHYQIKVRLEIDTPKWDDLDKLSQEYAELTTALCKNPKPVKGTQASWDTLCKAYAAEAKGLSEAVGKKDRAAAATAFKKLHDSCQGCHDEHR